VKARQVPHPLTNLYCRTLDATQIQQALLFISKWQMFCHVQTPNRCQLRPKHILLVTLASHCMTRFVSDASVHLTAVKMRPSRVQALALGGNQIAATCDGTSTNLHATWGERRARCRLWEPLG